MSRPSRILLLNERCPRHPRAGGAEVHVAEISRRLAERGHQITQLAIECPGAPAREHMDGMEVRRLGGTLSYYTRAIATVARETRQGRWDVVVEHLNKVPFCSAVYSAVPVVAVNHHLFGRSAFLQVPWPIAAAVVGIESLIPWVYRRATVLAVSESSRADLVARGLPGDGIGLVYNGVNPPSREISPMAQRPLRIAYLGRLEPYKRVDLLLRAAAEIARRRPELEVVIVGRGTDQPRLEALTAELGLAERTTFTGFVSDAERDGWIAEARICVCPSVKEGWGITVVEANALGVPVIATDAPGLRDAVRHEHTGLLLPDGPADVFTERLVESLTGLLDDEPQLSRLSGEALAWARRFTWEASAQVMDEALASACRTGRPIRSAA